MTGVAAPKALSSRTSRYSRTARAAHHRDRWPLPKELCRTLIWDRGSEMTDHVKFTVATKIGVFFCDHNRRGSAAATKTPTGFCANISPAGSICPVAAKQSSAPSRDSSTCGHEKPCNSKHTQRDLPGVLPRSVESTGTFPTSTFRSLLTQHCFAPAAYTPVRWCLFLLSDHSNSL